MHWKGKERRLALFFFAFLCLNLGSLCERKEKDYESEGQRKSKSGEKQANAERLPVSIPDGMIFEFLSGDMQSPRTLAFSKSGDLIVGSTSGDVYRLKAPYARAEVFASFEGTPNGVAFRETAKGEELWVADSEGLYKIAYDPNKKPGRDDFILVSDLPPGGERATRTIKVGPDGALYLSIGLTDNCSDEYGDESYPREKRRGGILRLDDRTGELKPFASGLRNPIGFDWQPTTGTLYAENSGPDHWGYDNPPDVFVEIDQGAYFGMPWFQIIDGKAQRDDCMKGVPPRPASEIRLPVAYFPSRSSPMDMVFVKDEHLLKDWRGSALVALHGSWGTAPSGGGRGDAATRRKPAIVLVEFEKGKPTGEVSTVVSGFQDKLGDRFARPMGLAIGPDGALYISSDGGKHGLFRLRRKP